MFLIQYLPIRPIRVLFERVQGTQKAQKSGSGDWHAPAASMIDVAPPVASSAAQPRRYTQTRTHSKSDMLLRTSAPTTRACGPNRPKNGRERRERRWRDDAVPRQSSPAFSTPSLHGYWRDTHKNGRVEFWTSWKGLHLQASVLAAMTVHKGRNTARARTQSTFVSRALIVTQGVRSTSTCFEAPVHSRGNGK